mgnify:CR=1 FL=1
MVLALAKVLRKLLHVFADLRSDFGGLRELLRIAIPTALANLAEYLPVSVGLGAWKIRHVPPLHTRAKAAQKARLATPRRCASGPSATPHPAPPRPSPASPRL